MGPSATLHPGPRRVGPRPTGREAEPMTVHKHLNRLVRARMAKTGERYAAARRHVLRDAPQPPADPASRWHFPGCVPATTALRVLLAHAGVRAPHTGQPFTE